jgi:ubiquinone/menaquinone biosynthesis C-methylase UbiE
MNELYQHSEKGGSKLAFWMISAFHNNWFLSRLRNPREILKAAGLAAGQHVLEVGCGPGFYTFAASEIVGPEGHVYAVDVNPWAIKSVRQKVQHTCTKNVTPICANAARSGLSKQSLDCAFLFGLPRVAGGFGDLIQELGRIIKPAGLVSIQKSRRSEKELINDMNEAGFFIDGRKGRLLLFTRR